MDYLWSPWRYTYITAGEVPACIFCELLHSGDDEKALIVYRGEYNFIILNAFPYTSGHSMIVPFEHLNRLHRLSSGLHDVSTRRVTGPGLRIGEVARRTGLAVSTLRAWETRYGLLTRPGPRAAGVSTGTRTSPGAGGARLVAEGWSVGGAARHVLAQPGDATGEPPAGAGEAGSGDRSAARGMLLPRSAGRSPLGALAGADGYALLAAYETARDLLRATRPVQVRDTLVNLVRRLGGTVGPAVLAGDTVMAVDLAFGEGPPLLPRAPAASVARMRLEAVLPPVIEDARLIIHRLQVPGPAGRARQPGGRQPLS